MKPLLVMVLVIAFCGFGWSIAQEPGPRFGVYLVDLVDSESTPAPGEKDSRYRKYYWTQEYLREKAVLRGPPILTDQDIVEYCWDSREIVLSPEGEMKWKETVGCNSLNVGRPVQVLVDGKPLYCGLIWSPASSQIPSLPVFWCMSFRGRLGAGGGDPKIDLQVKKLMRELGKLREACPE